MSILEARCLVKRFYGHAVVDHVSFTVDRGEVVGYLGANGSGKTTTTRILTGLIEPTSGDVFLDGRATRLDPIWFRRRFGYVPEEPHLYPFLSGREHLELIGRLRKMPSSAMARKIGALLELFGLSEAAEQSIGSYSRGMKQKVLVIAALLHDPDLLIFDEPDSGLDVAASLVLRHLISQLAARGKAILYTSHILDVVERLCTRVIVLHEGRVVADDSVEQLRGNLAGGSLEQVFLRLVARHDPERVAQDIADVVTSGG